MAERQRARRVEEEKVEEKVEEKDTALALYGAMLNKVSEMYLIGLKLESGPQTVIVLNALAVMKASIDGAIEKVREEAQMMLDVQRYEERERVEDGAS